VIYLAAGQQAPGSPEAPTLQAAATAAVDGHASHVTVTGREDGSECASDVTLAQRRAAAAARALASLGVPADIITVTWQGCGTPAPATAQDPVNRRLTIDVAF
jgi:outer membrane protein OmpA-like peptidoglycan-associated protein